MAKFTSKEAKPTQGSPRGEWGIGRFGTSRFGATSGRLWDKEAKQAEAFSKVAKQTENFSKVAKPS